MVGKLAESTMWLFCIDDVRKQFKHTQWGGGGGGGGYCSMLCQCGVCQYMHMYGCSLMVTSASSLRVHFLFDQNLFISETMSA